MAGHHAWMVCHSREVSSTAAESQRSAMPRTGHNRRSRSSTSTARPAATDRDHRCGASGPVGSGARRSQAGARNSSSTLCNSTAAALTVAAPSTTPPRTPRRPPRRPGRSRSPVQHRGSQPGSAPGPDRHLLSRRRERAPTTGRLGTHQFRLPHHHHNPARVQHIPDSCSVHPCTRDDATPHAGQPPSTSTGTILTRRPPSGRSTVSILRPVGHHHRPEDLENFFPSESLKPAATSPAQRRSAQVLPHRLNLVPPSGSTAWRARWPFFDLGSDHSD